MPVRGDMKFLSDTSSVLRSLVRYRVEQDKRNFVSVSGRMYYFVSYVNDSDYETLSNFPKIFRSFWKFSEYCPKVVRTFPIIFGSFPKDFREGFEDVSIVNQYLLARLTFKKRASMTANVKILISLYSLQWRKNWYLYMCRGGKNLLFSLLHPWYIS